MNPVNNLFNLVNFPIFSATTAAEQDNDAMDIDKENASSQQNSTIPQTLQTESKKRKVLENAEESGKNKRAKIEDSIGFDEQPKLEKVPLTEFHLFSELPADIRQEIFMRLRIDQIIVVPRASRQSYKDTRRWDIIRRISEGKVYDIFMLALKHSEWVRRDRKFSETAILAIKSGFLQIADNILEDVDLYDASFNELALMQAQAYAVLGDQDRVQMLLNQCRGTLTVSHYFEMGKAQLAINDFAGLEETIQQSNHLKLWPIALESSLKQGNLFRVQQLYDEMLRECDRRPVAANDFFYETLELCIQILVKNNLLNEAKVIFNYIHYPSQQFDSAIVIAKAESKKLASNEAETWFKRAQEATKGYKSDSSISNGEMVFGRLYKQALALAESGYLAEAEEIAKGCGNLDQCLIFMKLAEIKGQNDRKADVDLLSKSVKAALNSSDGDLLGHLVKIFKDTKYVSWEWLENVLGKFKNHLAKLKIKAEKTKKDVERYKILIKIATAQHACDDTHNAQLTFEEANEIANRLLEKKNAQQIIIMSNLSGALAKMDRMFDAVTQINKIQYPYAKAKALLDTLAIFIESKNLSNPKR